MQIMLVWSDDPLTNCWVEVCCSHGEYNPTSSGFSRDQYMSIHNFPSVEWILS